ncbi:hypothetical protein EV426DRAFT_703067 [Tirmania nivea]|nr:hypothetical protein EV426DRAFT_703067 [Tirmania nivea]
MVSLPSDPVKGPLVIPPQSMFTTIFANLSGSKRFTFAQSLDSQTLLQACIECEPFLEFFFKYEEIIVPGVLRTVWGHTPKGVQWQRCVLLQQEVIFNLQETTVKEAITDYLKKFQSGLPSKAQVDDAVMKKGKGHPKMTDLEVGDKPSWKLVFWFFPNLAMLVCYENMVQENHLARLLIFLARHLEPSATFTAARMWKRTDVTHFPKLPTIDNDSGQAFRGLVKFCLQRHLFVQREEQHNSRRAIYSQHWPAEDRIDIVRIEIACWLYDNYTAEVIEEMHQIYQSLERFLAQLWRCAREYAIEDAIKGAGRTRLFNQDEHPDPDYIGPDSKLVEDVVCKQAAERLLVTLGSSRSETSKRLNVNNDLTIVNLDDFIWQFMESNPVNYTVKPTGTFRDFVKQWRSETILRQTLGADNYAWTNQRDADFFENTIRQVNDLRREKEMIRQAARRIAKGRQLHPRKSSCLSIIVNRVRDMVPRWKEVEGCHPMGMGGEYREDGNVEFVHHITMPKNHVQKNLPPLYPTNSPAPQSEIGILQDIAVSQNRSGAMGVQGGSKRS